MRLAAKTQPAPFRLMRCDGDRGHLRVEIEILPRHRLTCAARAIGYPASTASVMAAGIFGILAAPFIIRLHAEERRLRLVSKDGRVRWPHGSIRAQRARSSP